MRITVFGANGPTGQPAAKEPISTYSQGVANIVAAMERHHVRRLAVVSSSGEGHADGRFTARADLAASMRGLLDDDRYHRTTVGVITTVDNPTLLQWIWRDALAKK